MAYQFFDVGNDGLISEKREYVFTAWDPPATSDLKALRAAFDTNGDYGRTETRVNKLVTSAAMAVLANRTVTTTAVDGKSVTIQRDTTGGGWFDQVETRVQAADNSRTHTTTTYARDGVTIIARTTETISTDGLTRSELTDADGITELR